METILKSAIIPVLVSVLITIITTILLDRFSEWFKKSTCKREFLKSVPQVCYRNFKTDYKIPENGSNKFFIQIRNDDERDKVVITFKEINNDFIFEKQVTMLRIINYTNSGATITGIYGANHDPLWIDSNWTEIDIEPNKAVYLYANSEPQPITEVQINYLGYTLIYKIKRSEPGFLLPELKQIHSSRS